MSLTKAVSNWTWRQKIQAAYSMSSVRKGFNLKSWSSKAGVEVNVMP